MTPEELNVALKVEITNYRETNEISLKLKRLFMRMIWKEFKRSRYKNISNEIKYLSESHAYRQCCKGSIRYNPESQYKAIPYIMTIIRCSFADTVVREKHKQAKIELK
jgi:hypothetical protein